MLRSSHLHSLSIFHAKISSAWSGQWYIRYPSPKPVTVFFSLICFLNLVCLSYASPIRLPFYGIGALAPTESDASDAQIRFTRHTEFVWTIHQCGSLPFSANGFLHPPWACSFRRTGVFYQSQVSLVTIRCEIHWWHTGTYAQCQFNVSLHTILFYPLFLFSHIDTLSNTWLSASVWFFIKLYQTLDFLQECDSSQNSIKHLTFFKCVILHKTRVTRLIIFPLTQKVSTSNVG